ncbi:putative peptidoglycan biosynthesis protein MurJ [Gammaproteobacteria bacterium MOLA455]|nr:putative peptidoglycan biosynthesis protein MurJ [Gammaproteobacteria bacterium MOLA455]
MNQKPSNDLAQPSPAKVKADGGLLRSSGVVSFFTMLSRVLGLARDIIFARVIGAEALADVFFVAFKIPNFFRRLFAEGAFAQAFVPVLGEYRQNGSQAALKQLINRVFGTLGMALLALTLVIVVAAPFFAALFAPKWYLNDPFKFNATAEMLRITFPYLLFISMTGVAGGILNSYDRFAVPAFTPVLLNMSLIFAALIAAPWFDQPTYALAWGVFAAGAIQFCFQLPFLARVHMLPIPVVDWRHPGVKKILKLMGPAIFGVSVSQINLMLDTMLATFLPTGSVSWLYYSDRLSELPLGVFAVAIATVILPNLSRHHAASSVEAYSQTLDWALRMVLLIAVPAAAALMLLAEPILATLFLYGEVMTPRDMSMASLSLRAYSLGLIAFMLIKVLAPGFFARQDMRTPVRIGVIAMVSNMFLNLILVIPLHFYWQVGHVGLALATSLSAFLNALLLFLALRSKAIYLPGRAWLRFLATLLLAVTLMVATLIWLGGHFDAFDTSIWQQLGWWQRSSAIACICLGGFSVYIAVLGFGGMRLSDLKGPVKATTSKD